MSSAPQLHQRSREEAAGAVGSLFRRHGRMVYGVCRAMLRDAHEAEDATQQVFLAAHQALLGGTSLRNPGAWLATIARNECRARIASAMRRPLPVADEDLDALPATGDEHERRLRLEELRAALTDLPERQREAVVLRYLYGLRYGEVATALGLSRPATEALLFRARRAMRGRLRPVVSAVLVVPSVVRDELALVVPGFGAGSGTGVAAVEVSGGLLAKLTTGPAGVKVATAVAAVSTIGAVSTVPSERAETSRDARTRVADAQREGALAAGSHADGERYDSRLGHSGSSSTSGAARDDRELDGRDDRASPGTGSGSDDNSSSGRGSTGGPGSRGGDRSGTETDTSGHEGTGDERTQPAGSSEASSTGSDATADGGHFGESDSGRFNFGDSAGEAEGSGTSGGSRGGESDSGNESGGGGGEGSGSSSDSSHDDSGGGD